MREMTEIAPPSPDDAPDPATPPVAAPVEADRPAETPKPETPAPAPRRRDPVPYLYLIGLLALGGAVGWLWLRPPPDHAAVPAISQGDLAGLASQDALDSLARRVTALENRPLPAASVLPAPPDLGPLESRLNTALSRIAALETRPTGAAAPAPAVDTSAISARQDSISSRQEALAARLQAAENEQFERVRTAERALSDRLAALEARIGQAEALAGRLNGIEDRTRMLMRLASVRAALQAGQPLGEVPGAPAALTRFATQAPPTLAALKLAYPEAARAALAASAPVATPEQGVLESAWNRAQNLVTLRRGDEVIIGAPDAGVLERARLALEAGDLARAVAALERLQPAPAAAMAGWMEQAQSLLAAEAALTDLEAQGAR